MGINELLTVKEVAELLKTSRVQVRRMIQNGELIAVKVGREYRIPLSSIEDFCSAVCYSRNVGARIRYDSISPGFPALSVTA